MKKVREICHEEEEPNRDHELQSVFGAEQDQQLLLWLNRRPLDWTLTWSGSGQIFGWGHNHRGQLGGVDGAKVKLPVICTSLASLTPVKVVGGEQTLFALTSDGKVQYAENSPINLRINSIDCCCRCTLLVTAQAGVWASEGRSRLPLR